MRPPIIQNPKSKIQNPEWADHEALFRLVYERRWADVLAFVHAHRAAIAGDALLARAAEAFADAFFAELEADGPAERVQELETLFLLHTGGFYRLPAGRFAGVVAHLVALNAARPEAALGYARHCPDHPACAALLRAHDTPPPARVAHGGADTLDLARNHPAPGADHTIRLFKSQQEVDFFLAVREVFATYLVYPNVALSCLVDYDALRDGLTPAERGYFFRAVVDCVVFDQHEGYRPRFFFEVDSPLHDAAPRQARDRAKEHILALAGQTLHRIRPRGPHTRADYVALLKAIAGGR